MSWHSLLPRCVLFVVLVDAQRALTAHSINKRNQLGAADKGRVVVEPDILRQIVQTVVTETSKRDNTPNSNDRSVAILDQGSNKSRN